MRWDESDDKAAHAERTHDWSGCAIVERVAGKLSGAPVLVGTRMPVETIVDNYDAGMEPAEIAVQFELPLRDVLTILSFREQRDPNTT